MLLQKIIMALSLIITAMPLHLIAGDIKKIDNDLYVGHKGDLYFVFECVTPETINFWQKYIKNQTEAFNIYAILPPEYTAPFKSFKESLKYYSDSDVWIAYVTTKKITQKTVDMSIDLTGTIEMAVPIMTTKNLPFYTPLGIIRAVEFTEFKNTGNFLSRSGKLLAPFKAQFTPHKNLSIALHSFVAQALTMIYGNKEYLITRPVTAMSEIFQKNLPQEALWIGSRKQREEIKAPYKKGLEDDLLALKTISDYENKKISAPQFIQFVEDGNTFLMHPLSSEEKQAWQNIQKHLLNEPENILRVNMNDMVAKMKQFQISLVEKYKQRYAQFLSVDETKSPIQDIDMKHKTMSLLNRSGKKVSFKLPSFFSHPHLGKGSLDPFVIVDIDALEGLLKLD